MIYEIFWRGSYYTGGHSYLEKCGIFKYNTGIVKYYGYYRLLKLSPWGFNKELLITLICQRKNMSHLEYRSKNVCKLVLLSYLTLYHTFNDPV